MFQITTQPFGTPEPDQTQPLTEYLLENTDTGEFAAIIPGHGAVLRRLVLRHRNELCAVLHGPESTQALLADETYAGALLYPFPGRIRQACYSFDGRDYALPANEHRGHALHGLVADKPFVVVDQIVTAQRASLSLRYDYDGTLPGYPFPFSLAVVYELLATEQASTESGRFVLSYAVQNTGTVTAPAAFGWHPYFSINDVLLDEMSLRLPSQTAVVLDDDLIPTGTTGFGIVPPGETAAAPFSLEKRQLDTPFVVDPAPDTDMAETVLTDRHSGRQLVIGQQTGPDRLKYVVVYTPARRDRIAIEPQTANADAFNNGDGLIALQSGQVMSGLIRVGLRG
jgi:aldose 1-epimerase